MSLLSGYSIIVPRLFIIHKLVIVGIDYCVFILETYRPRFKYKAIPRADFPGRHDYECDHSISLVNCQSLHFDEIEAMRQCDDDANCKAFVMSYEKTWIGNNILSAVCCRKGGYWYPPDSDFSTSAERHKKQ